MNFRLLPTQPRNRAGFVLLGVGLCRTGTMSLRTALCHLLDGACHHCADMFRADKATMSFWENAYAKRGDIPKEEWVKYFQGGGYRAAVDVPAIWFYK